MTIQMIIAAVLIALGFLLMLSSLIGIVRFPDFFARLHAQGVGDTLGAFLILAGMTAAVGASLLSVKLLLIFIIIVLTNPIGTNLMMIAAINKEDYLGYRTFMEGGTEEEPVSPAAAVEDKEVKAETADHDSRHEEKKLADEDKVEIEDKAEIKEQKDNKSKDSNRKPQGSKKKPQNRKRKPSMNMNKAELLEAAAERGIEVPEEATKREILELIYSSHDKNRR